jgi:hypothetical protein
MVDDNTCDTLAITADFKKWMEDLYTDYIRIKEGLIRDILAEVVSHETTDIHNPLKPNRKVDIIDGCDRN